MEIDLAVQSTRLRAQLSGTLATLPLRPDPHRRVAMGVPAEKSVLVTLLFRPTADTLLGDYVGVPVRSPDPANIGALARRPPARNPGITAPAAGAATHSTAELRLATTDRCVWVMLSRLWTGWRTELVIVKPETVIAWHRRGFRL